MELFKIVLIAGNAAIVFAITIFALWKDQIAGGDRGMSRSVSRWIALLLTLLIAQYAVYGYVRYIEPNWIEVKVVDIKNPRFPKTLSALKIVQISDQHIKRIGFRERSMIDKVNALKPDLILITGDFIGSSNAIGSVEEVLSKLKAKKGIYGVIGNHDYRDTDLAELAAAFNRAGVRILSNESVRIDLGSGKGLWIIGLTSDRLSSEAVRYAYNGVDLSEPKIVLSHSSKAIELPEISRDNTDLMIVGDTHGGQVNIGCFREFVAADVNSKYIAGLFYIKGVPLYVNRGIGTVKKNIRFLCRPEITLFKLCGAGD